MEQMGGYLRNAAVSVPAAGAAGGHGRVSRIVRRQSFVASRTGEGVEETRAPCAKGSVIADVPTAMIDHGREYAIEDDEPAALFAVHAPGLSAREVLCHLKQHSAFKLVRSAADMAQAVEEVVDALADPAQHCAPAAADPFADGAQAQSCGPQCGAALFHGAALAIRSNWMGFVETSSARRGAQAIVSHVDGSWTLLASAVYVNGRSEEKPRARVHRLDWNDQFVIFGSASFWSHLSPETAVRMARGALKRYRDVGFTAKKLAVAARASAASDTAGERIRSEGNISVHVALLNSEYAFGERSPSASQFLTKSLSRVMVESVSDVSAESPGRMDYDDMFLEPPPSSLSRLLEKSKFSRLRSQERGERKPLPAPFVYLPVSSSHRTELQRSVKSTR